MAMAAASKASQCLGVLAEGPSTTAEVAASLGWSLQLANAHLQQLFLRGKVERQRFDRPKGKRGGPNRVWLWSKRNP